MATGLPPHIASGELIGTPWGNAVVDELTRLRTVNWQQFSHSGGTTGSLGTYDNGVTSLGPYPYPVQVTVLATGVFGYGGYDTSGGMDIFRLDTNVGGPAVGPIFAKAGNFVTTTLNWVWQVAPNANAGFKTRTSFSGVQATPITFYFSASGLFSVFRTDTV